MSQHDFVIDNSPGLAVRQDMNLAIQALVSQCSGPVEPTVKYPGMIWLDTSYSPNGLLKQRDLANAAWIPMTISATTPGEDIHAAPDKAALSDFDEIPIADSISTPTPWQRAKFSIATLRAMLIPVGAGMEFFGTTAPTGWLFPYGQAVSRTTYAALFAIMSTTYGVGNGTTTFNLPDKRGRASFGKDDMGGVSANRLTGLAGGINGDIMGAVGGIEAHQLTLAEMPSHGHGGATGTISADHAHFVAGGIDVQGDHQHLVDAVNSGISGGLNKVAGMAGRAEGTDYLTSIAGAHGHNLATWSGGVSVNHTHSITAQGSDTIHNNLPPGIVCNYIIYAGI